MGNLRVAFHPGERTSSYAGLDSNPEQTRREQRAFDSLSVSSPIRRVVGQQFAHSGDGVALLNASGAMPQPLGPLKQLSVARGDTVDVVAYGMYQQPARAGWAFSLAGFVAGLLQQPAAGPPPPDGGRRVRVLPLLSVGLGLVPAVVQAGGVPRAYVRVLVYNADSVLVDSQTKQLTLAAQGGYEKLSLRVFVPGAGYCQAYVANESDTDVFFDDVSVEHRQGLQVQENQYDPYGLDLAGLSKGATPQNKYSWNGKEQQTEFGLNWHDHGWRFYDPTLGRWVVTDPDGEKAGQASWGSYQFGMDNAVRYNDLDGRCPGGCPPTLGLTMLRAINSAYRAIVNTAAASAGAKLPAEKQFAREHPIDGARMHLIGREARSKSEAAKLPEGDGTSTNALRHGILSAMGTKALGAKTTKAATDSHEGSAANILNTRSNNLKELQRTGQTIMSNVGDRADVFVDQLNNAAGRQIANNSPNASDSQLQNTVLEAIQGNNRSLPSFYTFTPVEGSDNVQIQRATLTREVFSEAQANMNKEPKTSNVRLFSPLP